ncbi:Endoribonuclease L-PSP/chorismate mutase-like protein [Pavlovales sp. CCMP2436]|nr:Endoribonuclease L-PSP/chorismate mutase-like protein [Pavlovales sp. CCMP2436]|mmetsp:Transcript_29933/g.68608  ORF Transcript_29933/g.68608 Transcript_29933/m.68608 type:complete len:164 (-) Transcript_29933:3231-3722(-)
MDEPERLATALKPGEALPAVAPPGGHYLPYSVCGNVCYLSGYISRSAAGELLVGKVYNVQLGAAAARTCALGHLAILRDRCGGLDNVKAFHKASIFVNAESGYPDSPEVANGYTDLIAEVFGADIGMHSRSAIAVAGLPFDASVEIEAVVELWDPSLAVPRGQ